MLRSEVVVGYTDDITIGGAETRLKEQQIGYQRVYSMTIIWMNRF